MEGCKLTWVEDPILVKCRLCISEMYQYGKNVPGFQTSLDYTCYNCLLFFVADNTNNESQDYLFYHSAKYHFLVWKISPLSVV